jgi:hypothetical protein
VNTMAFQESQTSERERVEIFFPSSVELVVLARFAAATIGARAGFDLDEIDDLRLAVDELSVSFGPLEGDTCLRYEFLRDAAVVTVRCTREPTMDWNGRTDRASDVIDWHQARDLSEQLLDELVTSHGREMLHGRSVAWLTKQHETSHR